MTSQRELFERAEMKISPASALREPRLWIRRVVIWSEPGVVLREVPFRKGLNIIWSPDPAESEATTALGHGAGKTLLCRLVRYCLGEDRFAPEGEREAIAHAFPEGHVGAELVVNGERWAILRPIGHRRRHVAVKGGDLNDLSASDGSTGGIEELLKEIDVQIITTSAADLVPGTHSAWLTALAWLTRDQECRFDDALGWRAATSGSESPVRGYARTESVLAVRALVGDLRSNENSIREKIVEIERRLEAANEEARHIAWQVDRSRRELLTAFQLAEETVPAGRLAIEPLRRRAREVLSSSETDVVEERLPVLRTQLNAAADEATLIQNEIASIRATQPIRRDQVSKLEAEIPGASAALDEANNPVCPVCEVPIDRAMAEGCKLSGKLHDVRTLENRRERLRTEVAELRRVIQANAVRQSSLEASLTAATARVFELRARVERLELERDARSEQWRASVRSLDDVARLDRALLDLEDAVTRVNETSATLESLREQLTLSRTEHVEGLTRMTGHFDEIVHRLVSRTAGGAVRVTGRGLELGIDMGGDCTTAAIDSLKVIAFDLAAMTLAIEGRAFLPAFLVHDSPREADLGISSYHQIFRFAHALESIGDEPLFQYIVTTTTRPPDEYIREPWTILTLRGGPADQRLLRKDLHHSDSESQ